MSRATERLDGWDLVDWIFGDPPHRLVERRDGQDPSRSSGSLGDRRERHRLRRLIVGLVCRRLGHDFRDRYVGDGKGYSYCHRCKLGEN